MNSRERVLAALTHREPDRVPIDLGGSLVTGIGAVAYSHLKRCLGLEGDPPRVADIILQLAEVEEPVRRRFGVDVIGLPALEPVPGVRNLCWKPWTLPDGSPALISADFAPHVTERGDLLIRAPDGTVTQRMLIGTYHFLPVNPPLADANLEDLAHFEGHRISDEELEFLHRAARRLHEETDYAIFGWFGGSLVEAGQFARGWDRFLVDLKQAPEFAAALVERLAAVALADLERYLEAVGEFVHVVGFGDDLGIQTGLQFDPDLYRRFFKPYHCQIWPGPRAQPGPGFSSQLRLRLRPDPGPDRGRCGHTEPGANLGGEDGTDTAEAGIRRAIDFLGRGVLPPAGATLGHPGRGTGGRAAGAEDLCTGRRLHICPYSRHPGRRATGEHRRHVRRCPPVWTVSDVTLFPPLLAWQSTLLPCCVRLALQDEPDFPHGGAFAVDEQAYLEQLGPYPQRCRYRE